MKIKILPILTLLVATSVGAQDSKVEKVERNFNLTTQHLDTGGSFYFYTSVDTVWDHAVTQVFQILEGMDQGQYSGFQPLTQKAGDALGFNDLTGVGVSLKPVGDDFSHLKIFIHAEDGKGLWSLRGDEPGELESLRLVPADSVYVKASQFDFNEFIPLLTNVAGDVLGPDQGPQIVQNAFGQLSQNLGMDVSAILGSLGNETMCYLRLGEKVSIKLEDVEFTVPKPHGVISIQTQDDTLFTTIRSELAKTEELYAIAIPVPEYVAGFRVKGPANPVDFEMTIAQTEDAIFFCTSPVELNEALMTRKNGNGVTTTEGWKRLAANAPSEMNGVQFVADDFSLAKNDLIDQAFMAIRNSGEITEADFAQVVPIIEEFKSSNPVDSLAVRVNEDQGIYMFAQGNYTLGDALSIFGGPGMLAAGVAVAVPGFVNARETSRLNACQMNMSMIDGATQQYILENDLDGWEGALKAFGDDWSDDLVGQQLYIRNMPVCPSGGTYILNDQPPFNPPVTCTHPGHDYPNYDY